MLSRDVMDKVLEPADCILKELRCYMARKYTITTIDGIKYELHSIKADDKKIGFVPVRLFAPDEAADEDSKYAEFDGFIQNATVGELELIIDDWKYGNAVRLQQMARRCSTGEGFSETAFNKVYAGMTDEECMSFHRDHAGLTKFIKARWAQMQKDGQAEADEDKIWEELL